MEDKKKKRSRPRKPFTEPHRSEASSQNGPKEADTQSQDIENNYNDKKSDIAVGTGSPYDLKADRYKQKPTFSKSKRFGTVEQSLQGLPPKIPTLRQSESPRSA